MIDSIRDLIDLIIENKINEDNALRKLKSYSLSETDHKKYTAMIHKLFRKHYEPTVSNFSLPIISNDWYNEILYKSIQSIRSGNTLEDTCYMLFNEYRINEVLMTYFVQTACHHVRMSSLTDEEINSIGMLYVHAMRTFQNKMKSLNDKEDSNEQ